MRKELIDSYKTLIQSNIDCTFYDGIPSFDTVVNKGNFPAIGVAGGDTRAGTKEGRRDIQMVDLVIYGFETTDAKKEELIEELYELLENNPYDEHTEAVKHNAVLQRTNIYTDEFYQIILEKITLFRMVVTFKMYTKSNNR
jgi:hypothetical protein